MKAKWYISTLIIILSLFGVVCQQQIAVPNQEIVLQFTNTSITSEDTQKTIAIVKKQLQDIGVSNIEVNETENGKLTITYYSDADVASIKEIFSKEKIGLVSAFKNQDEEPSKLPFDENTISYNLDVYEIQNGSDTEWDLNGISVVKLKPESNRLAKPNTHAFFNTLEINESIVKVTYKTYYNIAIAIDKTSRKIPEVRAGPLV
ncbi:hypothetical protein BFR04_15985 [Gaetbulibacter sp. 4G1]|nr:hypothetical protein [Gaetbulibacter sp. 4G1]PIA80708.1 hypothetical protein BFR04_15985 [Gaetbulibacter sp. 4G1]